MKKSYLKLLLAVSFIVLLLFIQNIDVAEKTAKASDLTLEYISENGYRLRYPEDLFPENLYDFEKFSTQEGPKAEILIVPQAEGFAYDDDYLEEAAGSYRFSREYRNVTISEVKKLTSGSEDVSIRMLEVVHDEDMERFYIVDGNDHTLLITVSLEADAVEKWKATITKMIQTIAFE